MFNLHSTIMTNISEGKVHQLTTEGYSFDIGEYIRQAFSIFQKAPGLFIAYAILSGLISLSAQLVPLLGTIAAILVSYPILVGYYLAGHELSRGREVQLSTFFGGFEYFGNLAAVYLIQFLAVLAVMIPFVLSLGVSAYLGAEFGGEIIAPAIGIPIMLAMLIPLIYLSVSWIYAPLFVVFNNMGFWDAMEASRKIVHKRWWMVFAFLLALGLIMFGGAIALLIGLLVAYPVAMVAVYISFADITELNTASPEADIVDHLVG